MPSCKSAKRIPASRARARPQRYPCRGGWRRPAHSRSVAVRGSRSRSMRRRLDEQPPHPARTRFGDPPPGAGSLPSSAGGARVPGRPRPRGRGGSARPRGWPPRRPPPSPARRSTRSASGAPARLPLLTAAIRSSEYASGGRRGRITGPGHGAGHRRAGARAGGPQPRGFGQGPGIAAIGLHLTRAGGVHGGEVRVGHDDVVAQSLQAPGHPLALRRGLEEDARGRARPASRQSGGDRYGSGAQAVRPPRLGCTSGCPSCADRCQYGPWLAPFSLRHRGRDLSVGHSMPPRRVGGQPLHPIYGLESMRRIDKGATDAVGSGSHVEV